MQVWCLIHGAAGVDINVAGIGVVWRSGTLERAISKVTLVSNGPVHEDWAGCGKRGREGHCLREVTLPLLQLKCWGIAPAMACWRGAVVDALLDLRLTVVVCDLVVDGVDTICVEGSLAAVGVLVSLAAVGMVFNLVARVASRVAAGVAGCVLVLASCRDIGVRVGVAGPSLGILRAAGW